MEKLNEQQKKQVRELLARLVAIDSAVTDPHQAMRDRVEEKIADFLTAHLEGMGMTVEQRFAWPGRPNVIAHWPGQGSQRSLMFESHMDTVTVEGMTVDPFKAEIRDGKIFGRGTSDTKGTMAAFLTALEIAHARGKLPADKLYFVGTASEETGCDGATVLMESGFRTDAAIVGETTRCRVVTAHKAPNWLTIETQGRPCHASVPTEGVNAIEAMARVIQFVHGPWTEHIRKVNHPLLGASTTQVTTVQGGAKINIVPARCRCEMDTRFVPGRTLDEWVEDFKGMLAEHLGPETGFEVVNRRDFPFLDTPSDDPLVRNMLAVCNEAVGQQSPAGVNYFANTGPFSEAGIRSVLFGGGDIAQAHTADEFLELDELERATEIILTLLVDNADRSIIGD